MPDQPSENGVAVFGVSEFALVIVVGACKHAFKPSVLLFERRARLVEDVPDVGRDLLDLGPSRPFGHEELVLVSILGIRAFFDERLALLVEAVREALQEEQAEDVFL